MPGLLNISDQDDDPDFQDIKDDIFGDLSVSKGRRNTKTIRIAPNKVSEEIKSLRHKVSLSPGLRNRPSTLRNNFGDSKFSRFQTLGGRNMPIKRDASVPKPSSKEIQEAIKASHMMTAQRNNVLR